MGVSPNSINDVFGIFKAYTTRVGSGPFPTELFDDIGKKIAKKGNEFGATTGRPRRCGWLDLVALKYACQINGVTKLMMMKADVLSGIENLKICIGYHYKGEKISHFPFNIDSKNVTPIYRKFNGWNNDISNIESSSNLPMPLIKYIEYLESELNIPIKIISVGPDRKQTIFR